MIDMVNIYITTKLIRHSYWVDETGAEVPLKYSHYVKNGNVHIMRLKDHQVMVF